MLALAISNCAIAEILHYDGTVFPEDAGWNIEFTGQCDRWIEDGLLNQYCELGRNPGPTGEIDSYTKSLSNFAGTERFFVEFDCESSISDEVLEQSATPTAFACFGTSGVGYRVTITSTRARFFLDSGIPFEFVDISPGPHKYRLELTPGAFSWAIDDKEVYSGVSEGPYPSQDSFVVFLGRHHHLDNHIRWDYITFGDLDSPIPSASNWGLVVLGLLLANAGTLIYRCNPLHLVSSSNR
jgi:hypothetical protein